MDPIETRIQRALARIEANDEELHRELQGYRVREETRRTAKNLWSGLDRGFLTDALALDAVTLRAGRPVLKVFKDDAQLTFEDPESGVWHERLARARSHLVKAIRASGRVELHRHLRKNWCGTGWLIASNVVVTNQHVADLFGTRQNGVPVFKFNDFNQEMGAAIDFLEEFDNDADPSRTFTVTRILLLEKEPKPDVALLRVEADGGRTLPPPLELAGARAEEKQMVAAIGYPARDSAVRDQALMERLFRGAYDKKRLSPGQVTKVTDSFVGHDCCALTGSSGSPLVDLESGEIIGLHAFGANLTDNYAVPAAVIAEAVDAVQRNLPFRKRGRMHQVLMDLDLLQAAPAPDAVATVTVPIEVTVTIRTPVVVPRAPQDDTQERG